MECLEKGIAASDRDRAALLRERRFEGREINGGRSAFRHAAQPQMSATGEVEAAFIECSDAALSDDWAKCRTDLSPYRNDRVSNLHSIRTCFESVR